MFVAAWSAQVESVKVKKELSGSVLISERSCGRALQLFNVEPNQKLPTDSEHMLAMHVLQQSQMGVEHQRSTQAALSPGGHSPAKSDASKSASTLQSCADLGVDSQAEGPYAETCAVSWTPVTSMTFNTCS